MRILIVEDHDDTARLYRVHFRQHGHEADVAASADEACRMCASDPYDLLVCDVGLPDLDGWSLLPRLLRACDMPAIAVSGYGRPQDVARSRAAGFAAHLTKPVPLGLLGDTIRRVARERERAMAHRPA